MYQIVKLAPYPWISQKRQADIETLPENLDPISGHSVTPLQASETEGLIT